VRPLKNDVKSMTTASTADKLAPVLYTANEMDQVLHEGDYWFIVCGNVIYHVSYDDDGTFLKVPFERCASCGTETTSDQIAAAGQRCPTCKRPGPFTRAIGPDGQPRVDVRAQGHTATTPLSPLEVAFVQRAREPGRSADSHALAHQGVLRIASGPEGLRQAHHLRENLHRALAADFPVAAVSDRTQPDRHRQLRWQRR
jgi:hypothetical protein